MFLAAARAFDPSVKNNVLGFSRSKVAVVGVTSGDVVFAVILILFPSQSAVKPLDMLRAGFVAIVVTVKLRYPSVGIELAEVMVISMLEVAGAVRVSATNLGAVPARSKESTLPAPRSALVV